MNAFERRALTERRGLIPQIEPRYHYTYFRHIFDGGYSAGYYFYLWAELLDQDAFDYFRQSRDLFARTIADRFRREVLERIDLDRVRMVGYGFQIEMKYTAWRLGFKIEEVPIVFVDRTAGTSKMSSGIFGEAFWGVLRLPFRKIS